MSTKDPTVSEVEQPRASNEPPQPPPPSYSELSGSSKPSSAAQPLDTTGQGSSSGVYQAQAVGGGGTTSSYPGQAYPPVTPQAYGSGQPYGQPGTQPYIPPGQGYGTPGSQPYGTPGSQPYGAPGGQPYGQPGAQPYGAGQYPPRPPPGTNAVIYVVDDPNNTAGTSRAGMPMAMLFFILGLCTWLGYLFGMCYMNHPDPRERWWARMCAIMSIIWALIIIFACIFGTM